MCRSLQIDSIFNDRMHDVVLIHTYVAPKKSPIYSAENDDGFVVLNEKIFSIKSVCPEAEIFLAGDLNAKAKYVLDYIPNNHLDLVFGDTDYPKDTVNIDRNSKDVNAYNRFGLYLINMFYENDIHVLNGRLYDDVDGNITCISNGGKSLVDYIIASTSLFDKCT